IVVAETVPSPRFPGAAAILPLRLCGQAVGLSFLFAQPCAEIFGVGTRNIDYGMLIGLLEAVVVPGGGTVFDTVGEFAVDLPTKIFVDARVVFLLVDEQAELAYRDLRGRHEERLADLHLMFRTFGSQNQIIYNSCLFTSSLRQRSISA